MRFSALIDILSKANMVANVVVQNDCEVSDLNLMDQDYRDFNDHTVYFIDAEHVGFGTAIPECLLYSGTLSELKTKDLVNSARITSGTIAAAFRFVKAQMDTTSCAQQQYIDIVSKLVMGSNLDSLLTEVFTCTGNLFVAIDMSGKILAQSTPFYVDYPVWMHSVQQGYCDELVMDYIESRRKASKRPEREGPFQLYCRKINMYILCVRIIHENDLLGYFFAISRFPDFNAQTHHLLPLFAQRVKDIILRLKSYNGPSAIMQNNILMDAVAGASPDETRLRARIACLKFPNHMRAFVMHSSYFKDYVFFEQVLQPAVMHLLPNLPCFPWKNSLVALVATDANGNFPEEITEAVRSLDDKYHVLCGISNHFSGISQFAEYYNQAKTALSFSGRLEYTRPFFYFMDYALPMLLDKVEDSHLLEEYCHPALARLREYDTKKGTDLFNTLRLFTQFGFSKSKTAETLFTHRNTVMYRIQQIEKICGIDLSDSKLLFTMQLSFQICAYCKSGR